MLILTRRVDETIFVGDSITVTVMGLKGNQVQIGIHAPADIPVHREEVYYKIKTGGNAIPQPQPRAPARRHFIRERGRRHARGVLDGR